MLEVTKNVVSLPESVPESYEQIIKDVLGQKKCPRVYFGKQYISRWLLGLKESPIVFTSKTRWVIFSFQIKKY